MLSRLVIFTLLFICSISSIAQTTQILKLKKKKNYSERNILVSDSITVLINEVWYNDPNIIDEEGCFILELTLIDTTKAKELRKLNIVNDTSVIRCLFDYLSVWNWEKEITTITGVMSIEAWSKESIDIELNITVVDNRRNRTYSYVGVRKFKKSNKIHQSE